MILKQLIKIVAIFAISCSWAQEINVDIKKSKVYKSENSFFGYGDLEEDGNGGFVAVKEFSKAIFTDKQFYQVEFYDKTLKMTKSFELDFTKEYRVKRENHFFRLIVKNGFYHLIVFENDDKTNLYTCSVLTSKLNEAKFTRKELFKIENEKINPNAGLRAFYRYENDKVRNVFFNESRSAFGVVIDIYNEKVDAKNIYVFDLDFNKIAEYSFVKNVVDNICELQKIILSDNKNDVYLLNKIERESKKEIKELGSFYYELTRISEGNKINKFEPSTQSKDQFDIPEIKLNNNSLYFISYYNDGKDTRKGLAILEYNANDLALKSSKFNMFTEKLISDKQNLKGKIEWKPIKINKIYFGVEGIVVCGEEYREYTLGKTSYIGFDNIFVEKLNLKHEVYWEGLIKKGQGATYVGSSYLSARSFYKDGDLFFLTNIEGKNDKLDEKGIPSFRYTHNFSHDLYVFKFDKDGKFSYSNLINDKTYALPIEFNVFSKDSNICLFVGSEKDECQLYKITF